MEDLQATLQSVLSDPAQMAQIAALAESLGLKPPEQQATGNGQQAAGSPVAAAIGRQAPSRPGEATGNGQQAAGSPVAAAIGRQAPSRPGEATGNGQQAKDRPAGAAIGRPPEAAASSMSIPNLEGLDLGKLMAGLSAMQGREDRVLGALRPSLAPTGQAKADRALRAAKLARLAGQLLRHGREGHV